MRCHQGCTEGPRARPSHSAPPPRTPQNAVRPQRPPGHRTETAWQRATGVPDCDPSVFEGIFHRERCVGSCQKGLREVDEAENHPNSASVGERNGF